MVGILQNMMPGGTLPNTLRRFMPELVSPYESQPDMGAVSYQEATLDSHSQSSPRREGRSRSSPPRKNPHTVLERNENPRMENRARSPQRRRYLETVASTPTRQDN